MAWVQVRDLDKISPASKGNLAPRDCIEIAHLHAGHLEALPPGGGRRSWTGDIHNARDGYEAVNCESMAVVAIDIRAPVVEAKRVLKPRAPNTAIPGQITCRTCVLAVRTSPGFPLRAQPLNRCAIVPRCPL